MTVRLFKYDISHAERRFQYLDGAMLVVTLPDKECEHNGLFAPLDPTITHRFCEFCSTYVPVVEL